MPITLNGTTGITTPAIDAAAGNSALTTLSVGGNNISSVNSLGFRNRIINGDMRIDQRNAGASVTPTNGAYLLDRYQAILSQTSKYSVQQVTDAPTGYTNSMRITSLSAYSVVASDIFHVLQKIEGFNVADLAWGTASAQTITISFWAKSSLTGTFGGSVVNSAEDRSYPFSYTINAANTWEYKTVSVAGDTTGTWVTNNGIGLRLHFTIGMGSNYTATAGAWTSGAKFAPTGATSVVGTNGATLAITGVQLEAGSVATPFERRDYGRELIMCQRYYEKSYATNVVPGTNTDIGLQIFRGSSQGGGAVGSTATFKVAKRAIPSIAYWTASGTANTWDISSSTGSGTVTPASQGVSDGQFYQNAAGGRGAWVNCEYYGHWAASAEL